MGLRAVRNLGMDQKLVGEKGKRVSGKMEKIGATLEQSLFPF
jgi:hypothetical protein